MTAMVSLEKLPYRCPKCGDQRNLSSLRELRRHLEQEHPVFANGDLVDNYQRDVAGLQVLRHRLDTFDKFITK